MKEDNIAHTITDVEPANIKSEQDNEHGRCFGVSRCWATSICVVVLVSLAGIIAGIVLSTGADDSSSDTMVEEVAVVELSSDRNSIAANACPSLGVLSASSGAYSHYVRVRLDVFESLPSCNDSQPLYAAFSEELSVSEDRVVLSISASSSSRLLDRTQFRRT